MELWDEYDDDDITDLGACDCHVYLARVRPSLFQGMQVPDPSTIFGLRYDAPMAESLIRTSISQRIVNSPDGKAFVGGARFTVPSTKRVNGAAVRVTFYDRVFRGDVIVVDDKIIRDYDLPVRGRRDRLFAFDVKQILRVTGVDGNGNDVFYAYNVDYTLSVNGTPVAGTVQADGSVLLTPPEPMPLISDIEFVWVDGRGPVDGDQYAVEFISSPNYVVWDDVAARRATQNNDLPLMVMCVRRAYFNGAASGLDGISDRKAILGSPDENLDTSIQ